MKTKDHQRKQLHVVERNADGEVAKAIRCLLFLNTRQKIQSAPYLSAVGWKDDKCD